MPWCDDCSRFWNPATLGPGGECPTCGRTVARPGDTEPVKAPWHFKLLVGAAVAYLGWRAVQGVAWLVERV
jgi:hypothetical protein